VVLGTVLDDAFAPDRDAVEETIGNREAVGIIPGHTIKRPAAPAKPTKEEKRKPFRVLSVSHHKQGFASASVRESWRVDCHGSRR